MNQSFPFNFKRIKEIRPKYKGFTSKSYYIEMRDNVKIATEVLLPKNLSKDIKLPTILIQTRYWRAIELKKPFNWLIKYAANPLYCKNFVKYGFAVVEIDVRGTGASYGIRKYPFSEDEIRDTIEVVDWIISKPWSNGEVITWGNSYTGITSELSVTLNHPSLKAHIVKHNPFDLYLDAMFPGGCFNEAFIKYWSTLGQGLDQTKGDALKAFKPINPILGKLGPKLVVGVKSVEKDRKNLEKIAQLHKSNKYPFDYGEKVTFRDDPADEDGTTIDNISIFTKKEKIEKNNVPLYTWGSWQDSATADLVIRRFMTYKNPIKAVIGDWNHENFRKANPYFSHKVKANPSKKDMIKDWILFFKDGLGGKIPKKILYYYTMGEEKWKSTESWPPKDQIMEKWYLREQNILSRAKPPDNNGYDDYKIDFTVSTGIRNRWYTLLSLPVFYPNREIQDAKCLTYTSEPLKKDIEITGHPIITLFLESTHKDGMIHALLEFIDKNNKIHVITDGQLRLIHRKISEERPPYATFVPYHSFKRKDYLPLKPNEIAEISFGLYPVSILVKKGSRLRLVIAGADKDTFMRYPKEGNPTIKIHRNLDYPSNIQIPIIQK